MSLSSDDLLFRLRRRGVCFDSAWETVVDSMGHNGYDVAGYLSDGLSIWPCGKTVDANEGTGVDHCSCATCRMVRQII